MGFNQLWDVVKRRCEKGMKSSGTCVRCCVEDIEGICIMI